MWPYLDKAVCEIIRSSAQAIFAGYIGTFCIESIEFEKLSLPPTVHDVAVEREVEGDLLLGDMVQGLGLRAGVIDGAINKTYFYVSFGSLLL
ncbi:synaptotagmin-3-like isoform X1 [Raphanus sativus]|uniref:Synaptotagmin-3-like isoform X1 n=1 Tax=Raphanus sativus TaxID=3726 RepID=A0A6J0LFU8_RAPSA|nr:synaptotagmin-3-like isoform X1 [Raphanus sativus]XP_018458739.1 synaptotagmin-3-like isoform X1 [Raphanus sativus]